MIYPWCQLVWQWCGRVVLQERLPHALLFSGPSGLGKMTVARHFAQWLLCLYRKEDAACDDCKSCKLVLAESHPDLYIIEPADDKSIKIDQIRSLVQSLAQSPNAAQQKIVILKQAHTMNRMAGNALLKSLEEPPGATVFILTTDKPSFLLPTIRSRCTPVRFPLPTRAELRAWLLTKLPPGAPIDAIIAQSGGLPMQAMAIAEDDGFFIKQFEADLINLSHGTIIPEQFISKWKAFDYLVILERLLFWFNDLIRSKLLNEHGRTHVSMKRIVAGVPVKQLFEFVDKLIELKRLRTVHLNVNQPLQLTNILADWVYCCSKE